MTVTFRPARFTDRADIMRINRAAYNSSDAFKGYQVRRFLENPAGTFITEIILFNGIIAGWAAFLTNRARGFLRLYSLCIDPSFQGRGIGRTYLSDALSRHSGYPRFILEVRLDNAPAIHLYHSLGFRDMFIFRDYYRDKAPALRMQKDNGLTGKYV